MSLCRKAFRSTYIIKGVTRQLKEDAIVARVYLNPRIVSFGLERRVFDAEIVVFSRDDAVDDVNHAIIRKNVRLDDRGASNDEGSVDLTRIDRAPERRKRNWTLGDGLGQIGARDLPSYDVLLQNITESRTRQ